MGESVGALVSDPDCDKQVEGSNPVGMVRAMSEPSEIAHTKLHGRGVPQTYFRLQERCPALMFNGHCCQIGKHPTDGGSINTTTQVTWSS